MRSGEVWGAEKRDGEQRSNGKSFWAVHKLNVILDPLVPYCAL